MSSGALVSQVDVTVTPSWELAARLDLVGLPADPDVVRRSQILALAATFLPTPRVRLRLHGELDRRPQALKKALPPAPVENDGAAIFLQAQFSLGDDQARWRKGRPD
jgi:hypothetical protein